MLELRPVCEQCKKALPPDSEDAVICSYECTYCRSCAELLQNVCPNCAGGFAARPIRPSREWKVGVSLVHQPATTKVIHRPVDLQVHAALVMRLNGLAPGHR